MFVIQGTTNAGIFSACSPSGCPVDAPVSGHLSSQFLAHEIALRPVTGHAAVTKTITYSNYAGPTSTLAILSATIALPERDAQVPFTIRFDQPLKSQTFYLLWPQKGYKPGVNPLWEFFAMFAVITIVLFGYISFSRRRHAKQIADITHDENDYNN